VVGRGENDLYVFMAYDYVTQIYYIHHLKRRTAGGLQSSRQARLTN